LWGVEGAGRCILESLHALEVRPQFVAMDAEKVDGERV
jgi:hypothetical protein